MVIPAVTRALPLAPRVIADQAQGNFAGRANERGNIRAPLHPLMGIAEDRGAEFLVI